MRFALVGKIDVNRDGRDDREELKRMIQEAGGIVDFDLPPLTSARRPARSRPAIDWYVIDDRTPLRDIFTTRIATAERRASQARTSAWARSSRKPGSTASGR